VSGQYEDLSAQVASLKQQFESMFHDDVDLAPIIAADRDNCKPRNQVQLLSHAVLKIHERQNLHEQKIELLETARNDSQKDQRAMGRIPDSSSVATIDMNRDLQIPRAQLEQMYKEKNRKLTALLRENAELAQINRGLVRDNQQAWRAAQEAFSSALEASRMAKEASRTKMELVSTVHNQLEALQKV